MDQNFIEIARFNMIHQQIQPWEVFDTRVLEVLKDIPRENFVPEAYKSMAFADIDIPIGSGKTMLSPKIEAKMLQAIAIQPGDNILEISTATGYVTACLAKLGGHVTTMDISEQTLETAKAHLDAMGIGNVTYELGNPFEKLPIGPYDAIVLNGSIPQRNPRLEDLLKIGGRMIAAIGSSPCAEVCLITRTGRNDWLSDSLFDTEMVSLVEDSADKSFVF